MNCLIVWKTPLLTYTKFRQLSFLTGRGGRLFVGWTRISGGGSRVGPVFFSGPKGGQNFWRVKEGGPTFFIKFFFAPAAQFLL